MDESWANMDSQDSPRLGLGGSHYFLPYGILCAWPQGLHPNVILSQDSQVGSPKILKIRTPTTLEAHNFLPLNEVRFKGKLYPLSRVFQQYVARHLHASKLGRFLTFSGRESNWHRPFFCP
jgi:hypothetical protein